ncbi:hypothetical protein COOONC_01719 [Cooperia oncophora]
MSELSQPMFPRSRIYDGAAAYTKPKPPPISQTKLSGRGLKDLDDHDIDGLLSNLSIEELEDLNDDFDPDMANGWENSMVEKVLR